MSNVLQIPMWGQHRHQHLMQGPQRGLAASTFTPQFLRFSSCLASSSTFALTMPSGNSVPCCYGGQGSENKAIFFPTANRSQKRLYVQTHLIKGLPPLAVRAVVTNRSGFLATVYSGVPQWKQTLYRQVLVYVKFKFKSDSAERLFIRCLKV